MTDPNPNPNPGGGNPNPPAGGGDGGNGDVAKELATIKAQLAEKDKQIQTFSDELKRTQRMNQVLMDKMNKGGNGGGMNVSDTVPVNPDGTIKLRRDFSKLDPVQDPGTYARELISEAVEQISSHQSQAEMSRAQQEAARKQFYSSNSDLVGWESVVRDFAVIVANENPNLPVQDAFAETAKRAREFLKSKGVTLTPGSPDNPPQPLPGGNAGDGDGGNPPIKPPKDEPYDPAKEAAEAQKDYLDQRSKERKA